MSDKDINKIRDLLKEEQKTIIDRLDDPETGLKALNDKSDTVIAEMHEVRKLSKVTYELVKFVRERTKDQIDEIRKHLGLPTTPPLPE